MRSYRDEAVVLKKQDFGEADRILTLFTRAHGKVKVLAKGVRRPTSRKGGNLDLLTHASVLIHKGRGLDLVREARSINAFSKIKKEVKSISKAYYICEITDGLCAEGVVSEFVFDLLVGTLSNFQGGAAKKIWDFELKLLNHLGFLGNKKERSTKGLKSYVEEVVERELKTPKFFHELMRIEQTNSKTL